MIPDDPSVADVDETGTVTLPQEFVETTDLERGTELLVYEESDRIVLEPIPSIQELRGIHKSGYAPGELLRRLRETRNAER